MLTSPFSLSPDPLSIYLTDPVRIALKRVQLTIDYRQGLATILGDPGLGKSTLIRYLYTHYDAQDNVNACLISSPNYPSRYALMKGISEEFGIIQPRRSLSLQQSSFLDFLSEQRAQGKIVIVFIDEAQMLPNDQLEQIRVLLNFETNVDKLIQIVLAGQLDLKERLLLKKNKAILSRIVAPTLLNPLSYPDMVKVIETRCNLAQLPFPFTEDALELLHMESQGIPRLVLSLCMIAHAQSIEKGVERIGADLIQIAISEGAFR